VKSLRTEATLLAFSFAVVCAQFTPSLPNASMLWFVAITSGSLAAFLLAKKTPTALLIGCLVAATFGASFTLLRAHIRMSDHLPREWEGRDIDIVGVIDGLPQRDEQRSVRFPFRVEQVLTNGAQVPSRIDLGWYKPSIREIAGEALPALHAGERWRWTVRLKRPHGYVNPAGFDLEAWMLERNVRASGSVQVDEPVKRIESHARQPGDYVERLRETIRERMQTVLVNKSYAGVLVALAIGDQQSIKTSDWALFNAAGISHLLSISGAHVTLFAAWIAGFTLFAWRRSPSLCAKLPAQKAAALVAAIVALLYATLSGFAVPAQRTCYMLVAIAIALWLSRSISAWLVLCWALAAVLVLDPWAGLSVGFWFSFTAVVLLLYVTSHRIGTQAGWRILLKTQLAVTLGLAPIAIAFFQQVSLVSPIANAIAIPLITFAVVPLTLIWLVIPLDIFLIAAHFLVQALGTGLQWLTSIKTAVWSQHAPSTLSVLLAIAGVVLMLAPRVVAHRWLGALWCLPLFLVEPSRIDSGEFRVAVLDIGQGTSVVVRTRSHTMVYDTGPRWSDNSDAGTRLIAPYLRASGSGHIDTLVVSHLDLDHSGGANSLLREVPTTWLLTSMFDNAEVVANAKQNSVDAFACIAGQSWQWDDVRFVVLHPSAESYRQAQLKTNERSCVIKVSGRNASLLLTGDIETASEIALATNAAETLRSDALLIPHHGSTTSSTAAFLDAVSPKRAFINAGYRNRFGHPRKSVLARYAERNIAVHRTDWHGAITIESKDKFTNVRRERDQRRRYWIDRIDTDDQRPIE
jgi:competence protein ComEC